MPQLVGSSCVRCNKRIESILEGKFCAECDSPVHNPCARPEADGRPLRCSRCGAERTEDDIKQAQESARRSRTPAGNQRPISLTVIGALLMIGAIGALIASTVTLDDPRVQQQLELSPFPKSIQLGFFYVGLSVLLLSGIGILVGYNWARWLYVISTLAGTIINLVTSPSKILLLPGILLALIFCYFLFIPKANAFFEGRAHE